MIRTAIQRVILTLFLPPLLAAAAQAQEEKRPEFVAVHVGFAERYKVGLWTPLEVTLRGGDSRIERCRVRANLPDSDGVNCSFEAPDCQLLPGQELPVVLYVRFGRESGPLGLQLLEGGKTLAEKTFNSNLSPPEDRFHDALSGPDKRGGGQRLIVSVEKAPSNWKRPKRTRRIRRRINPTIRTTSSRRSMAWQGCPRAGRATKASMSSSSPPATQNPCSPRSRRRTPASKPWSNGSAWAADWCSAPDRRPKTSCTPRRRWRSSFPGDSTRVCSCGRPAAGKPTPRAPTRSLRPRRAKRWKCPRPA